MGKGIQFDLFEALYQCKDFGETNFGEVFSLFSFYLFHAMRQQTEYIFCTNKYARSKLSWGMEKLKRNQAFLEGKNLISFIRINGKNFIKIEGIRFALSRYGTRFMVKFRANLKRDTLAKKSQKGVPDRTPPPTKHLQHIHTKVGEAQPSENAQSELAKNSKKADKMSVFETKGLILAEKEQKGCPNWDTGVSQLGHMLISIPNGIAIPCTLKRVQEQNALVHDFEKNESTIPNKVKAMEQNNSVAPFPADLFEEEKLSTLSPVETCDTIKHIKLKKVSRKKVSGEERSNSLSQKIDIRSELDKLSESLKQRVGHPDWAESQKRTRMFLSHIFKLKQQIGEEEFDLRLTAILAERFRARTKYTKASNIFYDLKSYFPASHVVLFRKLLYRLWEGDTEQDGGGVKGAIARQKRLERYGFYGLFMTSQSLADEDLEAVATKDLVDRLREALRREGILADSKVAETRV